jgi:Antitoxin VbhA
MTDDDQKPAISAEEMERRREHVKAAIADSRIEGLPPPSRPEQAILDAYIRGEIEAGDLVTAYLPVGIGPHALDPIEIQLPVIRSKEGDAARSHPRQPPLPWQHVHQLLRQEGAALDLLKADAATGIAVAARSLIGANPGAGLPGAGIHPVAAVDAVAEIEPGQPQKTPSALIAPKNSVSTRSARIMHDAYVCPVSLKSSLLLRASGVPEPRNHDLKTVLLVLIEV